jgi:cell division protease FtsH
MEKEVIFAEDVENIFGKRPWTSRSEEIFGKEEKEDNNDAETPAAEAQEAVAAE